MKERMKLIYIEVTIFILVAIVSFIVASKLDMLEILLDVMEHYEHYEIDEIITVSIVLLFVIAALLINRIRIQYELIEKLEHYSNEDHLTHLFNRRKIDTQLDLKIAEAKRYNRDFSVILFDIDNFKKINDIHGHVFGDDVLENIGLYTKQNIRITDVAGRWGGEEFIIVLDGTLEDAINVAEKIRKGIEELFQSDGHKITSSFGVVQYDTIKHGNKKESLVSKADECLYKAKHSGKNCVIA